MAPLTLPGSLNMLTALIDWRDETARCVGVFRADGAMALEVEYKVHMDPTVLDLLARAFLKAGIPIIRGSKATAPVAHIPPTESHKGFGIAEDGLIPTVQERTQTLKEEVQARKNKFDRRTKEGRAAYEAAERERLQHSLAGVTGGNNGSQHPTSEGRAEADVS